RRRGRDRDPPDHAPRALLRSPRGGWRAGQRLPAPGARAARGSRVRSLGAVGAAVEIVELGRVPYADAMARHLELLEARRRGEGADVLLLLEHPAVVTLGRGSHEENLRVSRDLLRAQGVDLFEVARGGDVTWHGPGQLVGYPILDLAARGARD